MEIKVNKARLEDIQQQRVLFLDEGKFQFIYNKCHLYGWADVYQFMINGENAGYGCLWGERRDNIFEYYIVPPFRKFANIIFQEFHTATGAKLVECQSNDLLLSQMLFEFTENINAEAILFEDHLETNLSVTGTNFSKKTPENADSPDVGGFELEQNGETVATGGFMLNYNIPYADIYMEVKENFRHQGFGSLIVQELKKEVYRWERVPAARCNIKNKISKATLLKAGFRQCGYVLKGNLMKTITPILFLLSFVITNAQKKSVTYEQAFKNAPTGMYKPLPTFIKWLDDENVVMQEKDEVTGELKASVTNILTGVSKPYSFPVATTDSISKKYLPKDIQNFTLSPDKKQAAYTFKNNLYLTDIATKKITQLSVDGNDSVMNGYSSWVYHEEIFGRSAQHKAFWWSPDSKQIVFLHFNDGGVPIFPIYVPTGQYGYLEKQRFPMAGDKNPTVRIGIINITTKKTTWADFNETDDQYFGTPYFTPSNHLWVQWMNRAQTNCKVYEVNTTTGSKKEMHDEKQSTWVNFNLNNIEFLESGSSFILRSDKTGWLHFYLYDMNGGFKNAITQGEFNTGYVVNADEKNKVIYFTARKENSTRWGFYKIDFDGKNMKLLSLPNYSISDIYLSPDKKYYVATFSNYMSPPSIIAMNMEGKLVKGLGVAIGKSLGEYNLPHKKLMRVKSTDGLFDLPVMITYPLHFDSTKKYPVLMNIYGGPNARAVEDTWSLTSADIWWAQEGLIQVSVDNRGSGHFGKTGMNYIYRKMGLYEIEDFMAVGKWLRQQQWMDTARLCMMGFSYGGYMACMALTYGSSVFNYGIAYWPVTDWHLYDTFYTERYMDTPEENPEGYQKTSVFSYAKQYDGLLRLVHGTSDDNAHCQNSLQLIDTLENLNKRFEFMLYPGMRHGLSGAKWLHNKTETYRFLYKNLLNRKMPEEFER